MYVCPYSPIFENLKLSGFVVGMIRSLATSLPYEVPLPSAASLTPAARSSTEAREGVEAVMAGGCRGAMGKMPVFNYVCMHRYIWYMNATSV
eukprot:1394270-Amorphochlora_amoeboformis.AAC.1